MYELLDIFFLSFHTALILFNLLGWIWKVTRRWNLYSLLATAFSWFVLGIWYGFGYCPCTHWHWIVRRRLGHTDMPSSYIKFLIQEWTGFSIEANIVDAGTAIFFFLALGISIYLNIKDYKKK
ncbi:DUF2784 domain-containing protein [Fodinibius salsisoli]|uniref:DUF2784 domain-containing protein n=1 Tax=Fodinibius salsisoli TaxID=2820877 RepID=A0ABT3PMC9_9BACT|nr:DUF2784 domain-containing protein [Fodinibius salsisoli]MCW9707104.1 DUF2784 domain-containing protein [Fodinibius salsisoli]